MQQEKEVKIQQYFNMTQYTSSHLFTTIRECIIYPIQFQKQQVLRILPVLDNQYIVVTQQPIHTNSNQLKNIYIKYMSEDGKILDSEKFPMDKIRGVSIVKQKSIVVVYQRLIQNTGRYSIQILQWNLETGERIKLYHKKQKQVKIEYYDIFYFKEGLICVVENYKDGDTSQKNNIGCDSISNIQYNNRQQVGKFQTYSHRLIYYQIPFKNVNDKPFAILKLQRTNVIAFMKTDEKCKISFLLNQTIQKEQFCKFYIINIQSILNKQQIAKQDVSKFAEPYQFSHVQPNLTQIYDVFEIEPKLFYIKCISWPSQSKYICNSYIWNNSKNNVAQRIECCQNRQHDVQFVGNFREISDYQLIRFNKATKKNPSQLLGLYKQIYFVQYLNDRIDFIGKYVQLFNMTTEEIFGKRARKDTFQFFKDNIFVYAQLSQSEGNRISHMKLAQYAYGIEWSCVFLLEQLLQKEEKNCSWDEDLIIQTVEILKESEQRPKTKQRINANYLKLNQTTKREDFYIKKKF